MSKWGDPACPADDLTHYRNLRKRDLRDENQALRFTENETVYKVREVVLSVGNVEKRQYCSIT